jgi:hypothetical protein
MRASAFGVVRKDQNGSTGFEHEPFGNVLVGGIRLLQRNHGEVETTSLVRETPRNLEQPAAQQAVVVGDSALAGDHLEAAEEVARIIGAFLAVCGKDTADADGIGV